MNDEIKVNSELPQKLATLWQVKDALDNRDEKIGSLKEEIINYFLNNTEYDDTSLLLFEQRMISALEDYITSSIPNFDFRSELNKIDFS